MALTSKDLEQIRTVVKEKLKPIKADLKQTRLDLEQIKVAIHKIKEWVPTANSGLMPKIKMHHGNP